LDESFAALVRGPETVYPRGFPYLIPAWLAVALGAGGWWWVAIIGPLQWWYAVPAACGLAGAAVTMGVALATIRLPAFRADRHGIWLGLRSERLRPRHRQARLWWADVRQLRIEPRSYGAFLEISMGPGARIVPRRGPVRQALLLCGLFVMPFGLGRGLPRLTEAGRRDPQYRARLIDVTPEQLGVALAGLSLPSVEIIVISRQHGPMLARRPQPAGRSSRPPAVRPPAVRPPAARQGGIKPTAAPAPVAPAEPVAAAPAAPAEPPAGKSPAGRPTPLPAALVAPPAVRPPLPADTITQPGRRPAAQAVVPEQAEASKPAA
jgi:hypothetical protein